MDTIKAMQHFVRAVELGSLSAAARELGSSQPSVSKTLSALEKHLSVRLLERSTTRLQLTEQGRRYYERAKRVLEAYAEAEAEARGETEQPKGLLRFNAPVSLGVLQLNRLVHEFLLHYPDIEVELILNDRFVDLIADGVDVALRLGGELPPDAIARPLATSERYLVASPTYLAKQPAIQKPADLARHEYLRFAWLWPEKTITLHRADAPATTATVPIHGRLASNSSLTIRESFLLGSGLGLTPAWLVQDLIDAGQLQIVLPDWRGPQQQAHLLYPSRRYQPLLPAAADTGIHGFPRRTATPAARFWRYAAGPFAALTLRHAPDLV